MKGVIFNRLLAALYWFLAAPSRKPSPAILAEDNWHPERAREDLLHFMEATEGACHVELIMKDISTVHVISAIQSTAMALT